jgi:phosphatidylserine synthase
MQNQCLLWRTSTRYFGDAKAAVSHRLGYDNTMLWHAMLRHSKRRLITSYLYTVLVLAVAPLLRLVHVTIGRLQNSAESFGGFPSAPFARYLCAFLSLVCLCACPSSWQRQSQASSLLSAVLRIVVIIVAFLNTTSVSSRSGKKDDLRQHVTILQPKGAFQHNTLLYIYRIQLMPRNAGVARSLAQIRHRLF